MRTFSNSSRIGPKSGSVDQEESTRKVEESVRGGGGGRGRGRGKNHLLFSLFIYFSDTFVVIMYTNILRNSWCERNSWWICEWKENISGIYSGYIE